MDDATLNKKIAIMSNIVDSLGHEGLIDSHFQYFSPFDLEKPVEPEKKQEEPQLKTWTYGDNTFTEAPNFGPISEYLLDRGYEIGELDGKYYVFQNRLPATTNGWHAVLDPTSGAYQTAYKFASNGLLDYGIYDEEFARKIGSEENTKLRNKIIAEHNKKFPVEYYSQ
jgi:hypothetical protein